MNTRIFLILLVVKLLFASNCLAQLTAPLDQLLSYETAIYIDTPNAAEMLNGFRRCIYDEFYRHKIEAGRMQPLEFSPSSDNVVCPNQEHWLLRFLASVETQGDAVDELIKKTRCLEEKDGDTISSQLESSIVDEFAQLFPGRLFFAIEKNGDFAQVVFGFEYDESTFDWLEEFKAASSAKKNVALKPIESVAEVDIYYSDVCDLYFFSDRNVLYAVWSGSPDRIVRLAKDVVFSRGNGGSPNGVAGNSGKRLESLRLYQRVRSELVAEPNSYDLFGFCRTDVLYSLKFRNFHYLDPTDGTYKPNAILRQNPQEIGWSDTFGAVVNLDQNEPAFRFRTYFPQLLPRADVDRELMDVAFEDLDIVKTRTLLPFGRQAFFKASDLAEFEAFHFCQFGHEFSREYWKHAFNLDASGKSEFREQIYSTVLSSFSAREIFRFESIIPNSQRRNGFDALKGMAFVKQEFEDEPAESVKRVLLASAEKEAFADAIRLEETRLALRSKNSEPVATFDEQVVSLGFGSAFLIELADHVIVLPSFFSQMADLVSFEDESIDFVANDWIGTLPKNGGVKVLAVFRDNSTVAEYCAFQPLVEFFRCAAQRARLQADISNGSIDGFSRKEGDRSIGLSPVSVLSSTVLDTICHAFGPFDPDMGEYHCVRVVAMINNGNGVFFQGCGKWIE